MQYLLNKMKPIEEMSNNEFLLRYIEMHNDLNCPIKLGVGNRMTEEDIEFEIIDLVKKEFISEIDRRVNITEQGKRYLQTIL